MGKLRRDAGALFVNIDQNGIKNPGQSGKLVFHLARETAWCWLEISGKSGRGSSNGQIFLLNDPAWGAWALHHTPGIPKQRGFFRQLLQGGTKTARLDFVARVLASQTAGLTIKLSSRQRVLLSRIGQKSRELARWVPYLDADFFNLCCTLALMPALVAGAPKKQSIVGAISALGYPKWARTLIEAVYFGKPSKGWCQTRKMIWHGLRVVFATAKQLPKSIPQIAGNELEQSCAFIGIQAGKIRKSSPANANVVPIPAREPRSGQRGLEHLKVALGIWVSQAPRLAKNGKQDLAKTGAQPSHKRSSERTQRQVDLEKFRSEIIAELAGGAGHEINNPLAILLGRAQSLIKEQTFFFRDQAKEEGVRRLSSIAEQGKRIHVMIRKLARIGRPAPGRAVPVCLNHEMEKWLVPWRDKAVAQGIDFTCGYPENHGTGLWILIDPAYMEEALGELLDNAFVQVSVGGRIAIEVRRKGDSCLVDVSNNGPTIAPEVSRLLFNPFYSNRKAGRFSGLGLPLAKSLMEASGGKLILHSLGGPKPVCFRVQVPILVGQPHAHRPAPIETIKAA